MRNFLRNISYNLCVWGFIFAAVGTYQKIQYERIEKQGLETSATATKISYFLCKDSKGKCSSDLHLEYVDRDGVKQQAKTDIGKTDDKIREDIKSNPVVNIKYLEESPSKVLALSYSEDPIENLLGWTGITVVGAIGLFLCTKCSSSSRLKSEIPRKSVTNKGINLKKNNVARTRDDWDEVSRTRDDWDEVSRTPQYSNRDSRKSASLHNIHSVNSNQQRDDLRFDMKLSSQEARSGTEKQIKISHFEKCETCNSKGSTKLGNRCSICNGNGRIQKSRKLNVTIPAGVGDGTRLRVAGQGNAGIRGASAGNLYIYLHVDR